MVYGNTARDPRPRRASNTHTHTPSLLSCKERRLEDRFLYVSDTLVPCPASSQAQPSQAQLVSRMQHPPSFRSEHSNQTYGMHNYSRNVVYIGVGKKPTPWLRLPSNPKLRSRKICTSSVMRYNSCVQLPRTTRDESTHAADTPKKM